MIKTKMNNYGRLIITLFVALLVLVLVGSLATIGWLAATPRGRVTGIVNSATETELTLINEQRQLLAVQLVTGGNIATHLQENGLPTVAIALDYRGETAVSLHLPTQTIYDFPTIGPVILSVILVSIILLLLITPNRFEQTETHLILPKNETA